MSASEEQADFSALDDPEFLAERARVRELLESTPPCSPDRAGLTVLYAAMSAEFDRRAGNAWASARQTRESSRTP